MGSTDHAPAVVLRTPELIDLILGFLHESSQDLTSCALLCRVFTYPSQLRLFDSINTWTPADLPYISKARRLRKILASSPHLRSMVHRISAPLDEGVLTEIAGMGITSLRDISFNYPVRSIDTASSAALTLARSLLRLPGIRKIELGGAFSSMEALQVLFQGCTPTIRALIFHCVTIDGAHVPGPPAPQPLTGAGEIKLTELQLALVPPEIIDWIIGPPSPFDFSSLTRLHHFGVMTPALSHILRLAQSSIENLVLLRTDGNLDVSRFPNLRELSLVFNANSSELELSRLPACNSLRMLTLRGTGLTKANEDAIRRIDTLLAAFRMPRLERIRVIADKMNSVPDTNCIVLKDFFAKLEAKGILEVAEKSQNPTRSGGGGEGQVEERKRKHVKSRRVPRVCNRGGDVALSKSIISGLSLIQKIPAHFQPFMCISTGDINTGDVVHGIFQQPNAQDGTVARLPSSKFPMQVIG
ncbi:hypothetical protein B0H13DRAFT_2289450 [Mycena leptocephala]|nr:hypothetical protein B0H13DRAFT_2289450 [Mycena leptocephala]